MKFRLIEDIDAVRKNFPTISDEDFNRIIRLDPTFKEGKNSVGTYGKWLLNLFNKGKLTNEGHVFDLLTRFESEKNNLKNKDIGRFKSIEEVDEYLDDESNYKLLSNRQELRKTQKAVRQSNLKDDAELLFENNNWEVWVPHTYEASCKLGQGTTWCTASTARDSYYNTYSDQGPLYINIDKHNPEEKYQFHFESGQFMDKDDSPIDVVDFILNMDEGLTKFYRPMFMKYVGAPEDADYNTPIKLNFPMDYIDMILCQSDNYKYNREAVSGATASRLIDSPLDEVLQWEFPYDLHDIQGELDYLINVENKTLIEQITGSTFEELIIDEDDRIFEALSDAYYDGMISGCVEEVQNDAIQALEKCTKPIKGVFDRETGTLHFEITPKQAYELEDMISDHHQFFDDLIRNSPANLISGDYLLVEPQYGWNDFDEDVFNERLKNELENIIDED